MIKQESSAIPSFHVISGKVVRECILGAVGDVIQIVEDAYRSHAQGKTNNPDSYFLRFPNKPNDRIIALPAHIDDFNGQAISGIKWISSFPGNITNNMPRASAVLILNDGTTGYPTACMEASIISAARTAASAVIAGLYLNGGIKSVRSLGIVGTGFISRYIMEFLLKTGWNIEDLHLHDLSAEYMSKFSVRFAPDIRGSVYQHNSAEDVIEKSDIIVFATTSATPYVHNEKCFSHNPIVLHISLRDLSPEIIIGSHNVVDDINHCLKANTSPHLAEQKVGHRNFVGYTLPTILSGVAPPDRSLPIVFSPFGMGILDIAVGSYVYSQALENGSALEIHDFFHELTRI